MPGDGLVRMTKRRSPLTALCGASRKEVDLELFDESLVEIETHSGRIVGVGAGASGFLVWQHYHQPALRAYEGRRLDQWLEDLDDADYQISDRAANRLVDAGGSDAVPVLLDACTQGSIRLHRRAVALLVRIGVPAAQGLSAALTSKVQQQRVEVALVRLGTAAVPARAMRCTDEYSGEAAAHVPDGSVHTLPTPFLISSPFSIGVSAHRCGAKRRLPWVKSVNQATQSFRP